MLPIRQKTAQLWPRATWQNNGSLVLAAGTAAWWYCLGFVAVLWRCARQGCFGMRVCSPAKSLLWWAEGGVWTVPISGQALLKTEQRYCTGWLLQSTGFIADLHITFARPVCYLGQDKIQRWGGPEQTDSLTCLTGT